VSRRRLVLASSNPGKLREIQSLLLPLEFELLAQANFSTSSPPETGLTFVENAIIKARYACEVSGLPALADDSGLEVDAIEGRPGIHSARFAGERASDHENNAELLLRLASVPENHRSARFQCVLVSLKHANDPTPLIVQGTWEGRILLQEKGENGFGYDSLFWCPEYECASAELSPELKNTISHRAKALSKLVELLAE